MKGVKVIGALLLSTVLYAGQYVELPYTGNEDTSACDRAIASAREALQKTAAASKKAESFSEACIRGEAGACEGYCDDRDEHAKALTEIEAAEVLCDFDEDTLRKQAEFKEGVRKNEAVCRSLLGE